MLPKLYEYELGKAADILVNELFKLKDETFVITAVRERFRVVDATARCLPLAWAMVIWTPSPLGVGKQPTQCSPESPHRSFKRS